MAGSFLGALTGGAIGSAVVRLVLDSDQYNAQLAAAKGQTATATTAMGGTFSKMKTLGVAAFAALGASAVAFLADSVRAAVESERVLTQLRNAVGENTAAYEEQALALQSLTGVQDEAIISAQTLLSRFELTEEQVRSAIPVVLDYAQAMGKDVPTAAGAVGKALLGNARALKEVGIDFTRTGDRAADFETILSGLTSKVGGSAEAFGQTFAGKMAIFSAEIDEAKEAIGEELLPVLSDLLPELTELATTTLPLVADAVGKAVETVEPFVEALNTVGDAVESVSGVFEDEGGQIVSQSEVIQSALFDVFTSPRTFIDPFRSAMDAYNEAIGSAADELRENQREVLSWEEAFRNGIDALDAFGHANDLAAGRVRRFRRLTDQEIQEFSEGFHSNFESVFLDLENFDTAFDLTARELRSNARDAAREARIFVRDLRRIGELDLDPAFLSRLQESPNLLHAFATGSENARDDIERAFGDIETASRIASREATANLESVPDRKTVDIEVRYTYVGYDPSKPIPGVG